MATSDASLGPTSKRHKPEPEETASTESCDGNLSPTLAEPAGVQNICLLCSSCQSLLVRPDCDPNTQHGSILTDPQLIIRRSLSEISSAARSGCIICGLLMTAPTTIGQDRATEVDAFKLSLHWFEDPGRFDRIDVIPVDDQDRVFTFHGHLDGIKLNSEDGIVPKLYDLTFVKLMSIRPRGQSN